MGHANVKPLILVKSRIPCNEEIRVMSIDPAKKPWFYNLQQYLKIGQFPEDADRKERMSLSMLSR